MGCGAGRAGGWVGGHPPPLQLPAAINHSPAPCTPHSAHCNHTVSYCNCTALCCNCTASLYRTTAPQVAFSEFAKQVQKNEVRQVVIDSASNSFTFTLRPTSALYKMLPGGWGVAGGRVGG